MTEKKRRKRRRRRCWNYATQGGREGGPQEKNQQHREMRTRFFFGRKKMKANNETATVQGKRGLFPLPPSPILAYLICFFWVLPSAFVGLQIVFPLEKHCYKNGKSFFFCFTFLKKSTNPFCRGARGHLSNLHPSTGADGSEPPRPHSLLERDPLSPSSVGKKRLLP